MTDRAVILAANSLLNAADMGVVDEHREALSDWLDARCPSSPTAISLLLTVLLGECLVASQTAVREQCDDPGCPDCSLTPVTLTVHQIADAVALMFSRLKGALPSGQELADLTAPCASTAH